MLPKVAIQIYDPYLDTGFNNGRAYLLAKLYTINPILNDPLESFKMGIPF
jgi:hypothetical protein